MTVGAVYSPVPSILPVALLPLAMPSTCQVTVESLAFCTAAWNCCVPDSGTAADCGVIVTTMGIGVTVACALADLLVSATLVALTV